MRSLVLSAIAASFITFTSAISQAESYCVSGCGSYTNPEWSPPEVGHDTGFGDELRPTYDDSGWGEDGVVDEPIYVQPRKRRYRKRSRHTYKSRRHRRTYRQPVYEQPYHDRYAGRTEFCRETIEKRGHGWKRKKVKVRRCVWVRNDLVPNHRTGGRYSDSW